jgi:excisionase family DNA binding protein
MTASPKLDLSTWLSDEEACARLGCAPRTLDREMERGHLHPQYRQRAGKRAQRVWNPEEIQAHMRPGPMQLLRSNAVAPTAPPLAEMGLLPPEATQAMIGRLVEMLVESRKPPKPWATLDEAAEELGLSRSFLHRLVKSGSLEAVKDRSIKVRRGDLETLDVSEQLIAPDPPPVAKRRKK